MAVQPGTEVVRTHIVRNLGIVDTYDIAATTTPTSTTPPSSPTSGRDLEVSGNPSGGDRTYEGALLARERFKISGNPSVFGTVRANDDCHTSGSGVPRDIQEASGNASVANDGGLELPIGVMPRITHWNEL